MILDQAAKITKTLAQWNQGDVFIGTSVPFIYLSNPEAPLTHAAREAASGISVREVISVATDEVGLMIVSQTCDIVRDCIERPYLEVCPIVVLPQDKISSVQGGYWPQFLYLPEIGKQDLAADLDRIMTIEKSCILFLSDCRQTCFKSENEIRILAAALCRKRSRVAFPDALGRSLSDFRSRILNKYKKNSLEGQFLQASREIRIQARPSWEAIEVEINLLFVFERSASIPVGADQHIDNLISRVKRDTWLIEVEGRAVGLDQLSAAAYLESDRLDLDHLSTSD